MLTYYQVTSYSTNSVDVTGYVNYSDSLQPRYGVDFSECVELDDVASVSCPTIALALKLWQEYSSKEHDLCFAIGTSTEEVDQAIQNMVETYTQDYGMSDAVEFVGILPEKDALSIMYISGTDTTSPVVHYHSLKDFYVEESEGDSALTNVELKEGNTLDNYIKDLFKNFAD
jgi:hypothetical protein